MSGLAQLVCPGCGFPASIEVFAADREARTFAVLMGEVPPVLATAVLRYLALFAPAKHRMTFPRMVSVGRPLVEHIKAGRIVIHKREITLTLAQWEQGLNEMHSKRQDLGQLTSHGYLWKVLAGYVEKLDAKAEAEQITATRNGAARIDPEPETAAGWDAEKAQQADRSRAITLAAGEMKVALRNGQPLDGQKLTQILIQQGIQPANAMFVAAKVLKPKPTP